MNRLALAIVEDIEDIRNGLADYFRGQPEFTDVLAVDSMEAFFDALDAGYAPGVVLSDIGLPGMNGIEGIKRIKEGFPKTDVIMLSVFNNSERIFKSICAGATGYALKDTPLPELKKAILDVHAGGSYMTPSIARKVMEYFTPKKSAADVLTPKEKQIVVAMTEGLSYKLIADRLSLSIDGVRFHIKNIYRKLQVNSKAEVIGKYHKGEL
jgi:DNA-binding NarL/FixJ family response regulator